MDGYLKQSTSYWVQIGPFVATDGFTRSIGLTLTQPEVLLSKNGGAWAQKGVATSCTHSSQGWYGCSLGAIDTGAVGTLKLNPVKTTTVLPVWHDWVVMAPLAYDRKFADTTWLVTSVTDGVTVDNTGAIADAVMVSVGTLGSGLTSIPWNADWDVEVESEVNDALGDGTGTALLSVPWNSNWDAEVQSEVNDALVVNQLDHLVYVSGGTVQTNSMIAKLAADDGIWANYVPSTDSQEAIRNYTAQGIPISVAKSDIPILMVDSTDHVSPKTGIADMAGTVSRDGGAFGAIGSSGNIAEIANGFYQYDALGTDMSGGIVTFRFTGTGADATQITFITASG